MKWVNAVAWLAASVLCCVFYIAPMGDQLHGLSGLDYLGFFATDIAAGIWGAISLIWLTQRRYV